jgi:hypothetical protein
VVVTPLGRQRRNRALVDFRTTDVHHGENYGTCHVNSERRQLWVGI